MTKRATVHDVARTAGVSLATVDRVLNKRPGVRAATIEKVNAAITHLGFVRNLDASLMARAGARGIALVIPDRPNHISDTLSKAAKGHAQKLAARHLGLSTTVYGARQPGALGKVLAGLDPQTTGAAIVLPLGRPGEEDAFAVLQEMGIPAITLLNRIEAGPSQFVGCDHEQAGRSAGFLMGRFLGGRGQVGVVASSLDEPDQRARLSGFRQSLTQNFEQIGLIGPEEGQDDPATMAAAISGLIADVPDLAGLYVMATANSGIEDALRLTRRAGRLRVITHELSAAARSGLEANLFDAVIDSGPENALDRAVELAINLLLNPDTEPQNDPTPFRLIVPGMI